MPTDITPDDATRHEGGVAHDDAPSVSDGDAPSKKKRRRRRKKPAGEGAPETAVAESSAPDDARDEGAPGEDAPRKKKRRKKKRKDAPEGEDRAERDPSAEDESHAARKARKRKKIEEAHAASLAARDPSIFDANKSFADLGLNEDIVRGIEKAGFLHPTAIQAALIPAALSGRDVLGQAKTGTGKTASFALPLLQICKPGIPSQAVVVAPTRELAVQITDEFNTLAKGVGLKAVTIYGGQRIQNQVDALAKGPEIIVGTPGRLLDMVNRGYVDLSKVQFAVLDEVDRMFDIGFRDDIRRILGLCPKKRQTIVVSATISPEIEDLARRHMRDPEKIVTSAGSLTVALVEQHHIPVQPWDKRRLLIHLLTHEEPALTVVFCRLKRTVDDLAKRLNDKGIESFAIHGDLPQRKREQIFKKLKAGNLEVLIASDLAARGLDVDGITHVINYDLPDDSEVYVHRIGRTARIGRKGVAWSLVTPEQGKLLTEIELLIGQEIPKLEYPDFTPRPRPDDWKDTPPQGHVLVEGVPDKKGKSRFAVDLPADKGQDADPNRFPGGVVPTKLPPKLLGGRTRTRRGR